MNKSKYLVLLFTCTLITVLSTFSSFHSVDYRFIRYQIDPQKQSIKFYWKSDKGVVFGNIENLQNWLNSNGQKLLFAMNGGMFKPDYSPVGLYIDNKKTISKLDTTSGSGNFYLKPNGVFYITTANKGIICKTSDFFNNGQIKYATQSGPMLVIDGKILPSFSNGSTNVNIRNGVGVCPDGKVIFVISKVKVNFYDLANYFKELGCKNALYMDGFVSKIFLPEKNITQTDGSLGVLIGVTKSK